MRANAAVALCWLLIAAPAAAAAQSSPPPSPSAELEATPPAPAGRPQGIVVGAEIGQPTSVLAGWVGVNGLIGAQAALGAGTWSGRGLTVHGEVLVFPAVVRIGDVRVVPHLGLGLRHKQHELDPASVDEGPDDHTGVRASLGAAALLRAPVAVFLEVAPGYDFSRSDSCTLASGVNSICPHAQSGRGFFDAVLGVRWYLAVP